MRCTGDGTSAVPLVTYPLVSAVSNNALWPATNAIDGNPTTCFSDTGVWANSAKVNGTFLTAWMAGPELVQSITLTARLGGQNQPIGFPVSYHIYLTAPDNRAWVDEGVFTTQPELTNTATITLPDAVTTYGVQILPVTLSST